MKTIPLPKVYGLTGGIGSGKSLVAKLFARHGVPTLDADLVARNLREPGQAGHAAILARFGTVDREALRLKISTDKESKQALESILHPLIRAKSDEGLKEMLQANPHAPFILYEASLILEAGRKADFKGIIVVTAPIEARISRIMARDHCAREAAESLIQAQNTDEFRLVHANYTILNVGTDVDLELEVTKVLDQIISS